MELLGGTRVGPFTGAGGGAAALGGGSIAVSSLYGVNVGLSVNGLNAADGLGVIIGADGISSSSPGRLNTLKGVLALP